MRLSTPSTSRGSARLPAAALVLAALAVTILSFAGAAPALAAPHVAGVTVLSSTSVKVVFDTAVTNPSATDLRNYGIAPDLPVKAASLSDGGHSVVLTTARQVNGQTYTATAARIAGGGVMPSPERGSFIGTVQGPDSATSGHDDFNRPEGLSGNDVPLPGPWTSFEISTLNRLSLTGARVFGGSGALDSFVSDTDPELDNALVRYRLADRDEYWLSAYLYVPSGQRWGSQQEIGGVHTLAAVAYDTSGHRSTAAKIQVVHGLAITSLKPASGRRGAMVRVRGNGFTGATRVDFNGLPARFTAVSGRLITATVPAAATSGRIAVTTAEGRATSPARFTVRAPRWPA